MSTTEHLELTKPIFEHHPDGFGVSCRRPRLSWKVADPRDVRDWVQTAYEIELTWAETGASELFRVASEESVLVPWPGQDLGSRQRVSVRVRCWGKSVSPASENDIQDGVPTAWSPVATVETALLDQNEWTASFITSSAKFGSEWPLHPLRFRRQFDLPPSAATFTTCRLYITALGVYKAYLNGHAISDECMAPGWTSYNHRLTYRVIDVGPYLNTTGSNVLSIEAAEGWYATKLGFRGGSRFVYGGKEIAAMAQLEVVSPSEKWTLGTDETWICGPSAITSSELYNGEVYDMRLENPEWKTPIKSMHDSAKSWVPAKTIPRPQQMSLITTNSPPVRIIETRQPKEIIISPGGKLIVDFGQNLVGKVRVDFVLLPADARLVFRHAEVLEFGELGTRPLCDAKCEDKIIGSGTALKDWSPKFTFHGFRYVQVDGWPGSNDDLVRNLSALVMHSDMKRRGFFESSNESLNKLHSNIGWSMKGNFLSIPTDCPQRDERLGWTGDIQIFCPTASFLYDTVGFLENWLQDLSAEQLEEGRGGIPGFVCPDVPLPDWPRIPQAIWHDVTVLTPHDLYNFSGDEALLERQFSSMQAWLDQGVDRGEDGLWDFYRWQFGDWLDPNAPPQSPALALTDKVLVADAYLVHVTEVFAAVCKVLGKSDLAEKYAADATTLKRLFQDKYISPVGNLMSNTQTGIALAVQFNLYKNKKQLRNAAQNLSKLVRNGRFRIATGFAGTPAITPALTATCQPQLAYRLLLEQSCPSWLYPVTMGATTMWERWDSMLPDGHINPGRMTSFNHYALGAVADWLHSSVGGISPVDPGWKKIRVRPVPGGNLTHAKVEFDGPYGLIKCSWRLDQDAPEKERFRMDLVVPPNSHAVVTLPCHMKVDVESDTEEPNQIVGSGVHLFTCGFEPGEWPPKPLLPPNLRYTPDMDEVAT